jgi:hypothetical protein
MIRRLAASAIMAAFLCVSTTSSARADERSACEVLTILALREPGGIDTRLAQLRELREPPFNAYTNFRLLHRDLLRLTQGTPATLSLPTGRTMRLSLTGRNGNRLKFQVSINRGNRSDYLGGVEYVTQRGEPFFQAGQSYQHGVLILGFVCR